MPSHAHIAPLIDIVRDGHGRIPEQLRKALTDSLRAQVWSTIVLDYRDWLIEEVDADGYQQVAHALGTTGVFWPVTGMQTRPEWVMTPRARDSTGTRSR